MIRHGQKILIGTDHHGNEIYGIVVWLHPKHRYALTERDAPYGNKIRECVMIGNRRGRLTNHVVSGWQK